MDPSVLRATLGRVIADRYRVEHFIGEGSISAVFIATDEVEDERVAVKIFDEQLVEDERFVARLLAAVEQAAELKHPNIVDILDWGVDDGPYIVSELCEGGSLEGLLADGHTLAPSQALVMALGCTRALEYAHEQDIVHRSITPRTVLFTDDDRVRLADLGLTKVLAEAPASLAARALESVRYASPEQARGRAVGPSSDMYSLALVVSEAASGRPPAVADTVVGTLMDRAESPAELDPAVGPLRPVLERCGRIDPTERPEAGELSISLLAAAETMERPAPMPLVGIGYWDEDEDDLDDILEDDTLDISPHKAGTSSPAPDAASDPVSSATLVADAPSSTEGEGASDLDGASAEAISGTTAGTTRDTAIEAEDEFDVSALGPLDDIDAFASDGEQPRAEAGLPVADVPGDTADRAPESTGGAPAEYAELEQAEPVFADVPTTTVEGLDVPETAAAKRSVVPAYEEVEDDADDRLPWWPLAALVALLAAAIAGGVYLFGIADSAETTTVPDLIGTPVDELDSAIGDRDWTLVRLETRVDGSAAGAIVEQSPAPGERLDDDGTLSVTVSLGNEMVEIPSDIIGLSVEQASSRLVAEGLSLGSLTEENNEELTAGLVIGLNEPTTQLPRGEAVDLLISTGPEDRIVPGGVVGLRIADATSLLVGLRLQPIEEPAFSEDVEEGTVLDMIPAPGEVVPADSAVTLIVSAGPAPVEMPDIVGLPLADAIDAIDELGLIFLTTEGDPGEDAIGSLPPIGATVDKGTEVTIILAETPADDA